MKKLFTLLVFSVIAFINQGNAQSLAVNNDGTIADASAILDIKSTNKGLLIPRVAATTDVSSPATGLLVYVTGASPGFYYNAGTAASPSWVGLTALGNTFSGANQLLRLSASGRVPVTNLGTSSGSGGTFLDGTGAFNAPFALTTTGSGAATFSSGTLNIPTPGAATFSSLTTTGSSGASSLSSGVLNIPTYTLAGLGGISASSANTLTNKDLTSGTNTFPTFNQNTTGSAATLTTPRNINGVAFDGSAAITITAAAGTLTGTTLNSTVLTSSLTSVGTLANLTVTNPIAGSITGNAATVTTNANLTGDVTSTGNATTIANNATSGNNIVTAIGSATLGKTGSGNVVLATSPTLVTPALGTIASGNGAALTGLQNIANNSTAGNSIATALGSANTGTTGTGSVVLASSPTLVTPALGTPTAMIGTNISGTANNLTAGAAKTLATARTINGVSFDGSANITIPTPTVDLVATQTTTAVTGTALTAYDVIFNNVTTTPTKGSYNNATGVYTANVAGTYMITAQVTTTSSVNYGLMAVTSPYTVYGGGAINNPSFPSPSGRNQVTAVVVLAANDTIKIQVYSAGVAVSSTDGTSRITITKL